MWDDDGGITFGDELPYSQLGQSQSQSQFGAAAAAADELCCRVCGSSDLHESAGGELVCDDCG